VDVLDKWLNMLEGYFLVHDFANRENIAFALFKAAPMSRTSGKTTMRRGMRVNPHYFQSHPFGIIFGIPLRNRITLLCI